MTKLKYTEHPSKSQINWGGNDDPQLCGLVVGNEYTLDNLEVHSSHTHVFLKEFPGKKFPSVVFDIPRDILEPAFRDWRITRGYNIS